MSNPFYLATGSSSISASLTRSKVSEEFEGYWRALRGTRGVPIRYELRPRQIPVGMLAGIFIQSVADGSKGEPFRYRLAGTRLRLVSGMELTGRTSSGRGTAEDQQFRTQIVTAMRRAPFGLWQIVELYYRDWPAQIVAGTLLPLASSEASGPDLLLGLLECDTLPSPAVGQPSLSPRIIRRSFIDIGEGVPDGIGRWAV